MGPGAADLDVPAPLSEDEVKAVADRAEAVAGQRLERGKLDAHGNPRSKRLERSGIMIWSFVPVAVLGAILWSILRALMRG
jgi:hypothetical protein